MNMKKEYLTEIKTLVRAERKLNRDYDRFAAQNKRQIARLQRDRLKAAKATGRELMKIDRRILILEGRLS